MGDGWQHFDCDMMKTRVVGGILWSLIMRWSLRLIGLASTVIMARLLTPADFGIVGMASIAIGLVLAMSSAGLDIYLIRKRDTSRDHYDAAWTMGIALGSLQAVILIALAPLAALYFNEPRLKLVLYVLALGPFISSFANIGIVDFRKYLEFEKDFVAVVIPKAVAAVVAIVVALKMRSYWALVTGIMVGSIGDLIMGYIMSNFRPKLNFTKIKEIIPYSISIAVQGFSRFAHEAIPKIVIGRVAGTDFYGGYHVASEVSSMATAEVMLPLNRGLLPNLALLKDQNAKFRQGLKLTVTGAFAIALPLGFGVSAVAYETVVVILGQKWQFIVPFLAVLAISAALGSIIRHLNVLMSLKEGGEAVAARMEWVRLIIYAPSIIFAGNMLDLIAIPLLLVILNFYFSGLSLFKICHLFDLPIFRISVDAGRYLVAAITMWISLGFLDLILPDSLVLGLILKILAGSILYILIALGSWRLFGSHEGFEAEIIRRIRREGGVEKEAL